MDLLTAEQIKALKGYIWDELLNNPNYDQHCQVNRKKLVAEMYMQVTRVNCWPEFLPVQALPAECQFPALRAITLEVADEYDKVD